MLQPIPEPATVTHVNGTQRPRQGPGPSARTGARRTTLLAIGILAAAWLAFVAPMFAGKVYFPTPFGSPFFQTPPNAHLAVNAADTDSFQAVYPYHAYLGHRLAQGHFPLWDPTRFAGVPFAEDIGMGTFYPPNWLYALGNPVRVGTYVWAATLLASLLLAFWFLRLLKLHPYAAALGAVAWTFSGWMMAWAATDPLLQSVVWLPLALAGVELARRRRARWGVPLTGLALGLSLLAGHVQVTYYVWLATGIWATIGAVSAGWAARRRGLAAAGRELARTTVAAAGAFALGVGVASAQILGFLEYAGQIVRQKEPVATVLRLSVPTSRLATALLPNYFGNPVQGTYRAPAEFFTETAFYIGVVCLPLALAGLTSRRRRLVLGFGLLTALGAVGAFGTPLVHTLYTALPGFSRFRWVDRMLLLVDVGLAGLAALGLDAVLTRSPRIARPAALGGCAVVAGGILLVTLTHPSTWLAAADLTGGALQGVAIVAIAGALLLTLVARPQQSWAGLALVGLLAADLWLFGFPYHPFNPAGSLLASTPVTSHLASAPGERARFAQTLTPLTYSLPPNAPMALPGLYSIDGYDPLIPSTFVQLLSPVQSDLANAAEFTNSIVALQLAGASAQPAILDLLGVRSLTTAPGGNLPGTLAVDGPVEVFDQPDAFPAAFLATCWAVGDDATVRAELAALAPAELRSTALVSSGPDGAALGSSGVSCPTGPAGVLTRYDPEDVVVSLPATDEAQGGILVLSDQWYPGWTATVDGRPAPILRVDLALRGVELGPGSHTVEFRYRPHWPLNGVGITALTLGVMAAIAFRPARRGRVQRTAATPRGTRLTPPPPLVWRYGPGSPPGRGRPSSSWLRGPAKPSGTSEGWRPPGRS